jgi:glycosidase
MSRRGLLLRTLVALVAAVAVVVGLVGPTAGSASAHKKHRGGGGAHALHSLRAPVTDENFYFVMADRFENGDTTNDTGGIPGDRLQHGFDPTARGFYNGGDLKGLLSRLDYIEGLGTTSIWLTPSFKNKAVQLEDGPSAGYHGYWITDFTQIDPHLGTNADLKAIVDEAHERGMKVYFDIITNHTADVIGYEEGARQPYVSKDAEPYRTAAGTVFDDRDFAGKSSFPALDPSVSFPYTPVLDDAEQNLKVPSWLNDVRLYHNRGDTTFVGENSQYGDFFGLDDLFTEHPKVVDGMIDIYQTWIEDAGVDGFRIDTMKHVNDEFWQAFGPATLEFAKDQGKPEFFMFGEVALDGSGPAQKAFTSQYTTHNQMQAILDFPFQDAARGFASRSLATNQLSAFFDNDDWYTDADSNAYQLPTFLGNHDMGRIGRFVTVDNPGAGDAEWLQRDRLAHELMYLSRGNPVVYYGDEQGFTGDGGDQFARQSMFASQVQEYWNDDLLGTDSTHEVANFEPSHPLYRAISGLAGLTERHHALRDGAQQDRWSSDAAGIYAFSRIDRKDQREYVVALNNSEAAKTAAIPTYVGKRTFERVYGDGPAEVRTASDRTLTLTVPALSAVVYKLNGRIPHSKHAPDIRLASATPAPESRGRMEVVADVDGSSFYEVTFQAKVGDRKWRSVGTDDNAPYRVYHDVSGYRTGTPVKYRAIVLDNGGHTDVSRSLRASVPAPTITIEAPREGSGVRDRVEVRAVADPERATHVVRFERQVEGGAWTAIGTDDSSPVYTAVDSLAPLSLAAGTLVHYRAILTEPDGTTVTSAVRTVRSAGNTPATTATLHYFRPAGDYGDQATGWGLHMWGDAVDPDVLAQIAWDNPWPWTRIEGGWAEYDIPLTDDTKPVNFIMHLPSGDSVPETREPGGDRSFLPLDGTDVYIVQGDPTVYTSQPDTTP